MKYLAFLIVALAILPVPALAFDASLLPPPPYPGPNPPFIRRIVRVDVPPAQVITSTFGGRTRYYRRPVRNSAGKIVGAQPPVYRDGAGIFYHRLQVIAGAP